MVQGIKFGVRLVAGSVRNSTLGHKKTPLVADGNGNPADGPKGDMAKAVAAATKGSRSLPVIHLEVSRASAAAIEAVESQGGTVTCAHFNRLALRSLVSTNTICV